MALINVTYILFDCMFDWTPSKKKERWVSYFLGFCLMSGADIGKVLTRFTNVVMTELGIQKKYF